MRITKRMKTTKETEAGICPDDRWRHGRPTSVTNLPQVGRLRSPFGPHSLQCHLKMHLNLIFLLLLSGNGTGKNSESNGASVPPTRQPHNGQIVSRCGMCQHDAANIMVQSSGRLDLRRSRSVEEICRKRIVFWCWNVGDL